MLTPMHKSLAIIEGLRSQANSSGDEEAYQLLINNFWKPSLSVIGFEGLPNFATAGNVVYKELKLRVSLRLPPTLTWQKASEVIKSKLEADGPETFGAKVEVTIDEGGNGFDAPKLPAELEEKFFKAHAEVFSQNQPMFIGCGGSIPFMEIFSQNFPGTNFLLTGVGFPDSNAHSANENIDLEFCKKLTAVIGLTLSQI